MGPEREDDYFDLAFRNVPDPLGQEFQEIAMAFSSRPCEVTDGRRNERFLPPRRPRSAAVRSLIEASAGTGKTFTIAGLVLRLLLERPDLTIDQILVTTFTELATAELRGRIRDLLRDALEVFRRREIDHDLMRQILREYPESRRAPALALKDALAHFDEAPIYTIHGFCQRVLATTAFETGTLFDAELVTDETRSAPRSDLGFLADEILRGRFVWRACPIRIKSRRRSCSKIWRS